MGDANKPLTIKLPRPLSRQHAYVSIPVSLPSPNPFIVTTPLEFSISRGSKRPSEDVDENTQGPMSAPYQPPQKRRALVATAVEDIVARASQAARPGNAAPSSFVPLNRSFPVDNAVDSPPGDTSYMPDVGFYAYSDGDTDVEEEETYGMSSGNAFLVLITANSTRLTAGFFSSPTEARGSTLRRRSTDASIVEGIRAAQLSVIHEEALEGEWSSSL